MTLKIASKYILQNPSVLMVFFCKESLEMEKVCLLWARFLFVAPSDIDQQANWRGESLKIKKGECGGMH